MGGLGKQGRRKARDRSVDMSVPADGSHGEVSWLRPDPESCEEMLVKSAPPGGDAEDDRLVIRMLHVVGTYVLVEFAIVLLTRVGSKWVEVAEVDSCHDRDVHLHQCGRAAGERVGERETLLELRSLEDVQTGYDVGLAMLEERWRELKERWHYA